MVPSDFQRKRHGLNVSTPQKATELRLFLIYTSHVLLKYILNHKCYFNFLCLKVSILIFVSKHKLANLQTRYCCILPWTIQLYFFLYSTFCNVMELFDLILINLYFLVPEHTYYTVIIIIMV